ncbi:MAG: efflux RND transporter periplasmic adaptor subunit [Gammaproteobacteria bacterium]|nr:MAG: efflux RND transporter periplasmic adaptor subunit [Gammaproteobacteria bacterium]
MSTFKQKKILASILAIMLLPVSSYAAEEGGRPPMPTPKADVFIVKAPQDLVITLKYPAHIKAFERVNVVARVSGILKNKYFTEGQYVSKGDLLYRIEDDIYVARVNVAKASVQMSQAALNRASRNWKRIENLFKSKTVSEDRRDTARADFEQATAALSLAKAELKQAQIDLDYTKVTAPISGIVGLKKVDVGDFVSSTPPTKLIEITQNNKVYVEFSIPLRDYANIKNKLWVIPENSKLPVSLEIDHKLIQRTGIVDFMDVNINQSTSTVKMRALIDNKDGYLMPGGFVRIILNDIIQKNIITIPQKAVLQNPLGTIVFIVDHAHVGVKPVIVGRETGDQYIVKGGPIASGDKVIINNFFRLKPGAEVDVDKIINNEEK